MSASRKRARARKLREQGWSIGAIAVEVGAAKSTVHGWLKAPEPDRPLPAPPAGNQFAVRHGVYSEARIAPRRAEYKAQLAEAYDWVEDGEILTQAQRLAMIEEAIADVDENGIVHPDGHRARDLADRISKWSSAAEAWFEKRRAEERDRKTAPVDLEAYLAEHYGDDTPPSEPEGATDAE